MSDPSSPVPPHPKKRSGKRKAFFATAVVFTLLIVILLVSYPVLFPKPQWQGSGKEIFGLGIRVNQTSPGNWTIYITGGSYKASSVRLTVINWTTGARTVDKFVSKLLPATNDPDAVFNDRTADSKFDAGDTIVLKASGGHIIAGYKVKFVQGREVIGTIKELPAEVG